MARALAVLPTVHDALAGGRVTFDHVRAIADQADSPNRDNLLEDIEEILSWALAHSADDFRDALAGWARDLDERREVGLSDHERQRRRRRLTRARTKDGLARTILDLDDEADAIVYGALRDIAAEMLRADHHADLTPERARATRQVWAAPPSSSPAAPGPPMSSPNTRPAPPSWPSPRCRCCGTSSR